VSPEIEGWQATDDPGNADSGFGLLTSAHAGAAAVTVVVTDSAGKKDHVTYDVTPRTSCWFAYTAWTAADGATLKVVDPNTGATPPVALAHNQGVYDFQFSPDGKYLCYRFGADLDHPHGSKLAVVNLTTWTDQQLSLSDEPGSSSDAVTAYAWSSDSSTLAVGFVHSGTEYLGGVRFAADGQLTKLTPKQTPIGADSKLYWIGTSSVAYYADGIIDTSSDSPELVPYEGLATAYYSPLGVVGFSEARFGADTIYQLPVFVQTTSEGFYLNSPSWPRLQFTWIQPGGPFSVDHTTRLVSPSGRVTADLSNPSLKLYRAELLPEIAANATDRDCPKLLTWAKNKERFVCVRDVAANEQHEKYGELRIFDLGADDTLTVAAVQGGYCDAPSQQAGEACSVPTYDYSIIKSTEQPRVLSGSGDWLAVSVNTDASSDLYLADLRQLPFGLQWTHQLIPTNGNAVPTVKLAFSPDESLLLQLLGGTLIANSVIDRSHVELPRFDEDMPTGTPSCTDDFQQAPDRWCGSADRAPPFKWDRRSRSVAYRSRSSADDEAIMIVDFTPSPGFAQLDFPAPRCGTKCSGQFDFQP